MKQFSLVVGIACGLALIAGCKTTPTSSGSNGNSSGLVWQLQPGINWGNSYATATSIAFGVSSFVVTTRGGRIYTSPDAITWTRRNVSTSADLWQVIWANSMFVAVGDSGTILTSPDGASWTHRDISATSLYNVVWAGNKFLIYGSQDTALISSNGISWTINGTNMSVAPDYVNFAWGNARLLAVVQNSGMYGSADGLNWTAADSLNSYNNIVWGNEQFVAVGYYIRTSPDGQTWTTRAAGLNNMQGGTNSIWANGKYFVLHGSSLFSSSDGIAWTLDGGLPVYSSGDAPFMCYGDGKLVIIDHGGDVATAQF